VPRSRHAGKPSRKSPRTGAVRSGAGGPACRTPRSSRVLECNNPAPVRIPLGNRGRKDLRFIRGRFKGREHLSLVKAAAGRPDRTIAEGETRNGHRKRKR